MRDNRLRTLWRQDRAAVNGWLTLPGTLIAETMAHQGWDSLTVDLQHGAIDYPAALGMLTAIATTDTVPLVRVPWLEPGIIMKLLDAGAYGVICPMINDRSEAERLVEYSKYPPRGGRSFGPVRATLYAGDDYVEQANDTLVSFAMIETRRALDNLDEILSVEGLDAIYVGPADLSLALGHAPGFDREEPEIVAVLEHILERARAHGVMAGLHNGSPEYARRMIERGFRFVSLGTDARLLAAAAADAVRRTRWPADG